jgi:trigger factor
MKLHTERKKDTQAVLEIIASPEELSKIKNKVLHKLAPQVKVAGFREGNVPIEVVEKNIDQQTLQSQFIDEAINTLYVAALKEAKIRPVAQPSVEVTKFVPYSQLEYKMEIDVVGKITLPNYKKTTIKRKETKVTAKDIDGVLKNLQTRASEKKEVKRAAKQTDEVWIDFKGVDTKGEPVKGADGKDYPLVIGSGTFIPGFEEKVIGMKVDDTKSFTITFPEDYGAKALQSAKVTFEVTVKKVNEVSLPKLDDEFAGKVGPFKTLIELKEEIKKQLVHEANHKDEREYEAELVNYLADKTKVEIPDVLIEEQKQMVLQEVRQNVVQRGMTFEEFLAAEKTSEEAYIEKEVLPEAIRRVKAGLMLSEIADVEGIDVSPEEFEARMQQLKGQYKDPKMQEEMDKPDSRREINARLRSEKTIQFLKTAKS